MFTRQQYMNNECTQREYYSQFVTQATLLFAQRIVDEYDLVNCEDQEHLNTPKIKYSNGGAGSWVWDSAPMNLALAHELGECSGHGSPCTHTCVGKAAAKIIIAQLKADA